MPRKSVIYIIFLLILTGCGGGGDSSSATFQTQALLGPVVDATVEIYDAMDLTAGVICSTMTSDSADLDQAGLINIPGSCVSENGLYLLLVSGGRDIDADDDGVIDSSPTAVRGRFHALITASQLQSGAAKATALTEAAYQHVRYLLAAGSSQSDIIQALDFSAQRLLKQDLDGNGVIDHQDLAIWHPRLNRDGFRPSLERLEELTNYIHVDRSTAIRSLRLHEAVSPQLNEIAGLSDADRLLINGSYLYVASGDGLFVVDISDPEAAQVLTGFAHIGFDRTTRMRVADDRLYIEHLSPSSIAIGVEAFDISNPAAPEFLSDEPFVPGGYDINRYFKSGNYAYVGLHQWHNQDDLENSYHEFRLDIIDISTPGSPGLVTSIALDSFVSELVVQGDRLYVGTELGPYLQAGGLSVFDIADVTAPRLINRIELGSLEQLTVIDDYAYAITRSEESGSARQVVSVFSLNRSSGAELIGSLETGYEIWRKKQLLMESASRGYLATVDGIAVIDFLDPVQPQIINQFATNGATGGMALSGSTLFAAVDNYGVQSFDVSGLSSDSSPAIIDTIAIGGIVEFAQPDGNQAFAIASDEADTSSGLFRINLSDPQSPIIATSGLQPDRYRNLTLVDTTLYATSMFDSLTLFDISNAHSIDYLSTYDTENARFTSALGVEGDVGVLSGITDFVGPVPSWNLLSLDLTQPSDPIVLSSSSISEQPFHIAMEDGLVFVSIFRELVVYRMDGSGVLSRQGTLNFSSDLSPVKLIPQQDFAFISYGIGQLGILDISNPGQPREISTIETPGHVADMTLSGDLLLIACNAAGLQVVDVSDPRAPRFVGNLPTQSPAKSVMVMNDRVYVATTDNIVVSKLPVNDVP